MLLAGPILFDASTPGAPSHAGTTTPLVTASFTPPAKSLVLAMAGAGWSNTAGVTMACSDSGSHTWTNPVSAIGTVAGNGGGVKLFYSYFAASPGAITVSIAYGGAFSTGGGSFLDLLVFDGAAASQAAAAVASYVGPSTGTTAGELSITTTVPNSWVWGMSDATTSNTTYTADSNTVIDVTDSSGSTDAITLVGWRGTGLTGAAPGATTFGGTWGSTQVANIAAFEVLPANVQVPPSLILSQAINRSNFY